jgi:hypothetical protein
MDILDKIKQIQILTPKSNDVLFISVDEAMTKADLDIFKNIFRKWLKERNIENVSYIVSSKIKDIKVVRKEE